MNMCLKRALFFLTFIGIVSGEFSLVRAQNVSVIKFDELHRIIQLQDDTTRIFNFWATWCGPCVKEFPAFEQYSKDHSKDKIKVIFVSLDFRKDLEKSLLPFVKKHAVRDQVYLLDESDYNSWINLVDSTWEGNLPATLVINNAREIHSLFPHEFTREELEHTLTPFVH